MLDGMDYSPRHLQLVAVDNDDARSRLDLFADLIAVVGDAETLWHLDTGSVSASSTSLSTGGHGG